MEQWRAAEFRARQQAHALHMAQFGAQTTIPVQPPSTGTPPLPTESSGIQQSSPGTVPHGNSFLSQLLHSTSSTYTPPHSTLHRSQPPHQPSHPSQHHTPPILSTAVAAPPHPSHPPPPPLVPNSVSAPTSVAPTLPPTPTQQPSPSLEAS